MAALIGGATVHHWAHMPVILEDARDKAHTKNTDGDVDAFFEDACKISGEWQYDRTKARLIDRILPKFSQERTIPLNWRTLAECLNPQPDAQVDQAGG